VILAASATLFTALKWLGAAYLIYLGIKLWRAPVSTADAPATGETRASRIFAHAYAVTALNPKSIVFFVAFVPQFISTAHSFVNQAVLYILTFDVMAMINATIYAFAARTVGARLTSPRAQIQINYASGGILLVAGVLVLALRMR
jgi:threonine/homoserine/homoserine lactone efflux protein